MIRRSAAVLLPAFATLSLAISGRAAEGFDYPKKFRAVGIEQEFRPLYSRPNALNSSTVERQS